MMPKHLPESVLRIVVILSLLAIGVGLVLSGVRNPFASPARVELQLGDDWGAIQRKSTYTFRDVAGHADGFATEIEPLVFVYSDPGHPLEFPVAHSIYFQFTAGRVSEIRLTQYSEMAEWAPTEQAVRALVRTLETAGWQPTHSRGSLDEVLAARRAYYDDPKNENFMNDQFLDTWSTGSAQVDLSQYRTHNEGDRVDGRPISAALYTIYFTFHPAR